MLANGPLDARQTWATPGAGRQRLSGVPFSSLPRSSSAEPAVHGLFLAETPLKLASGFPQRPLVRPTCEASPVRDSFNYHMPQPAIDDKLVFTFDAETLWIQPWGANALRIRSTRAREMPDEDWALLKPAATTPKITIDEQSGGTLENGNVKASITKAGKITVHNAKGDLLLEEYTRARKDVRDPKCSALNVEAREFKPLANSDSYHLTARFESVDPDEKLFGMGQYQQPFLDLKGHDLELAHRNSQASVPFALSSLGYGLLWNNPSIGRAFLGRNIMSFDARSTTTLDYWIVAGDTPAAIVEAYADATGKVPLAPEFMLGFWQCKLRYQTQEELPLRGEEELLRQWASASSGSTRPSPSTRFTTFDNYRYHAGPNTAVGNLYPLEYARAFYEGMRAEGQENIVNLLRCAWAGSQKYGALVWSGDIGSSWISLRNQVAAGLHMGVAGLPWWTTDIGGFHGGDPTDPKFRELFVRWFQWGAFCPVMRLHGFREPMQPQHGTTGGAACLSGAPNEVWSYGEDVYAICKKYMFLRETLREYTRGLMKQAHEKGTPVMRMLFYEFPEDQECWRIGQQYMYGDKYLCCPVLQEGARRTKVYLPKLASGEWTSLQEGKEERFAGGQWIEVDAPLEWMPVFVRE
ncbi:alpha-xylosidase [Verticillium alfalfae VaMs.102]|uniref:Alpha-xylosidase n=1 Tax=Verticillium alfalfae (strain VaMs.102 / ATCC MYA-4576 / FGSC 10136) TaxID=526221 RepID=C9SDU4_VERA1|nr:alpha-xylosidase [Verticillium alfalfae VaMs.102]EEY17214.1 alpha-xylosidase [Verticillium alfalfae VaMs.102]